MRALLLTAAATLALAGCDVIQNHLAKKTSAPAAAPAAAPAPVQATAAPPQPVPAEAAAQSAAAQAPAGPPPGVEVARWSRADYAKREARLQALIANAETRDTTGETQRRAEEGRYIRSRCATRACIEASYASEERWLKQWESSGG